eukprot:GHVP01004924.1.p2 GENE.GHVP01004924.1~~GHVP01004924.1.p2  ORF type:complete len:105 (+),score=11.69 GHVP01004924.1:258-572(+)
MLVCSNSICNFFIDSSDVGVDYDAVPLEEQDQPFYSFWVLRTIIIAYYTVLPMGCRNLPALFSEFMEKSLQVFYPEYKENIMSYQDDVAVAMDNPEETINLRNK